MIEHTRWIQGGDMEDVKVAITVPENNRTKCEEHCDSHESCTGFRIGYNRNSNVNICCLKKV